MTIRSLTQTTIIAGAASLLLLSGAALGQTSAPQAPQNRPTTIPTTQTQPQLRAAPDPLKMEDVSRVKGAAVYGSDNKKLGSVSTLLMEPASKTIDRLVVSDGGILGVGSHFVAIPLQEFAWDEKEAVFRLAISSDELKRMPEWKEQLSQLPAGSMPPPPPVPSKTAPAASGSAPKPIAPAQ